MNTLREAAQQALEALQAYGSHAPNCDHLMLLTSLPPQRKPCSCGLADNITALRAALAEPNHDYERGFVGGMSEQVRRDVERDVMASLERFASLVAAAEREAVGNIILDYAGRDDLSDSDESLLKHLFELIRARGE